MDESVLRAQLKWPNVPAVYGWLELDRRGAWLIRGERIGNPALREFIGRNYAADPAGRWYFQNGPQRVFVRLACTPLVYRLTPEGVIDHCGRPAGELAGAWLDEEGSLYLGARHGVGVLDDRDLGAVADEVAAGRFLGLAVGKTTRAELPARHGFVRDPTPDLA